MTASGTTSDKPVMYHLIKKGGGRMKASHRICLYIAATMILMALSAGLAIVFYKYVPEAITVPEEAAGEKPPNVVFILVDDLGFNDVSWNNPTVKTPHLEALARDGMILDQNYVHAVCSPSRGSLMTGMYAHHIGLQHSVILPSSPECASREHQFLPQKLKEFGYTNHMIGKWHLGFCNWNCTPTYRGFDTFYGFYQGFIDHYEHTINGGYDWRDGMEVDYSSRGQYSTDLITDRAVRIIENQDMNDPMFLYLAYAAVHTPLAAPQRFIDMYPDVQDEDRRTYLAMMTAVDESVGRVVDTLRQRGMMDDTLIIFSSDNGAEFHVGSNAPLRGAKTSIYEGGTRVPAFVHGRGVAHRGTISNGMVHSSDWFPTIVSLAGGSTHDLGLDGVDQTDLLFGSGVAHRDEIIYNLDIIKPQLFGAQAIRKGDYKLILGYPGLYDGWEQDGTLGLTHELDIIRNGAQNRLRHLQSRTKRSSREKRGTYQFDNQLIQDYGDQIETTAQLFNVRVDPTERVNLASKLPGKVLELKRRLTEEIETIYDIHLESQHADPNGLPENFGGVWTPGWCE